MNLSVPVAPHQRRRFSRWVQIGLPILGLALLWFLYHEVQLLFTSLVIAWGLYYILNPLVNRIEAQSVNRTMASAIVLIGLIAVMYLVWLRFVTFSENLRDKTDLDVFRRNLVGIIQQFIISAETKVPFLERFIEPKQPMINEGVKNQSLKSRFKSRLSSSTSSGPEVLIKPLSERIEDFVEEQLMAWAPLFAKKLAGLLPNLILIPYFTFFFLKDGRLFKKTMIEWIPNRYFEPALKFFYELDRRMHSYLQNLLLDCMLVGLLVGIGSAVVGAPYPVVLGLIAFVLNTIPFLGPILYGMIGVVLTIGAGEPSEIIVGFVGVFFLSRLCDDLIFVPTIYGKSHHMHPALVICVVLLGESLAGIWGMFLAIPVASILFLGLGIIREISTGEEAVTLPPSLFAPFA